MKRTELENAYRAVFYDMMQSDCGLLVGKYDATNGDESFMHGVGMVMEWIAYRADDDHFQFMDMFTNNMIESEEKARHKMKKGLDRFHP